MDARVLSLDDVLRERQRWCVPVYQRHYAWETGENKQLNRLWEDIREKAEEVLRGEQPYPHYIGAVIVGEPPNQPFGTVRQRLLVDGQQRITTFQLVLIAAREVARTRGLAASIPVIETYLFNEKSGGMSDPVAERYKLWPSSFDRALYRDLADNAADRVRELHPDAFYKRGTLHGGKAPKLLAAVWFLREQIDEFLAEGEEAARVEDRLNAILKGFLSAFRVVVIQLDQKDDAQEIFASLNDLGKPLTALDLIRNDVFHRARRAGEDDEAIFNGHWQTFESPFWEEISRQGRFKKARVEFFLGHFLVAETAKEANLGKLAAQYHEYARKRSFPTVAAEMEHMVRHVPAYRALVTEGSSHYAAAIGTFMRTWDQTTFHPLLLAIAALPIEEDQKLSLFRLLESYVVRRDLCDLTIRAFNTVVIRALQRLSARNTPSDLVAFFAEAEGDATRFPSDAELVAKLASRSLYGSLPTPRIRYVLERLENEKRTAFDESVVPTSPLTIEHVMPQSWKKNWPLPDGRTATTESAISAIEDVNVDRAMSDQIAARERLVNSIGNLTLVTGSLNPSLSDAAFDRKKASIARSLLVMNREIAAHSAWGESAIEERGLTLARAVASIWPPIGFWLGSGANAGGSP